MLLLGCVSTDRWTISLFMDEQAISGDICTSQSLETVQGCWFYPRGLKTRICLLSRANLWRKIGATSALQHRPHVNLFIGPTLAMLGLRWADISAILLPSFSCPYNLPQGKHNFLCLKDVQNPDSNLTLSQHWQWSSTSVAVCQHWPNVGNPTNDLKWLANGQLADIVLPTDANVGSMLEKLP